MKLLLDNQKMVESFFDDTCLLGVMASIRGYKFCWHLNNIMGMDLRFNNEIEIQLTKKRRNYFFSVYEYNEPTRSLSHYIYNNQHDGEYLLHEFKHLDYLWLMKGDIIEDKALQQKINSLRSINSVQLVTELTQEKIKSREHLVF